MNRALAVRLRSVMPYLGLILVILFFSLSSEFFFNPRNFQRLATDSATLMLVAFGMTLVILVGEIDLSVGAVVSLLSVAMAQVMAMGYPWPIAVSAGVAFGLLLGAVNGALTVFGRIPSFVVTLGMLSVATGLAFILTGAISVAITDGTFLDLFYSVRFIGVPVPLLLVALGFLAVWLLMNRTVLGRELFAVGANAEAARLSGVPVRRRKLQVFLIMGALVGVAAVLSASRLGSGAPDARPILTLDAIAAVIIGGASLYGGWASVTRTLVGALLIAVLNNGMVLLNVTTDAQYIVKGVIILIAVILDRLATGART
jgi:ribose/xylose/arabinose/galactoside ABC-type transport system permease subunit